MKSGRKLADECRGNNDRQHKPYVKNHLLTIGKIEDSWYKISNKQNIKLLDLEFHRIFDRDVVTNRSIQVVRIYRVKPEPK
jgi:hypothetical protein